MTDTTKTKGTRPQYYAGATLEKNGPFQFVIFRSAFEPTRATHGHRFGFVYGPYRQRNWVREAVERCHNLPIVDNGALS